MGCHEVNKTFFPFFIPPCPVRILCVCVCVCVCVIGRVHHSCFYHHGEFLKDGDPISTVRFCSPPNEIYSFLSDWELLNDGNQCPLHYFKSFSKGTKIPFPFSPLNPIIYFIKNLAFLQSTNIYWELVCAGYYSRHLELQSEQSLSSGSRSLPSSVGRQERQVISW